MLCLPVEPAESHDENLTLHDQSRQLGAKRTVGGSLQTPEGANEGFLDNGRNVTQEPMTSDESC